MGVRMSGTEVRQDMNLQMCFPAYQVSLFAVSNDAFGSSGVAAVAVLSSVGMGDVISRSHTAAVFARLCSNGFVVDLRDWVFG